MKFLKRVTFAVLALTVRGTPFLYAGEELGLEDGVVNVTRSSDSKQHRAFHGMTRALISNMVNGVAKPFDEVRRSHDQPRYGPPEPARRADDRLPRERSGCARNSGAARVAVGTW